MNTPKAKVPREMMLQEGKSEDRSYASVVGRGRIGVGRLGRLENRHSEAVSSSHVTIVPDIDYIYISLLFPFSRNSVCLYR